nr:NADH dehydrogenase subunit 4l [Abarenicola claparedi oceanica]
MTINIFSTLLPCLTLASIMALIIQRKHLLMSLLALEGMILTLALFLALLMGSISQLETFLCIILLTFGACEASLGLALLVCMTRSYGTDLVKSLTINKC